MSNQEEAIEDEIDSYELNDDFNNNLSQYSRSSTLLMDRFGDESPDEVVSVCVAYTVYDTLYACLINQTRSHVSFVYRMNHSLEIENHRSVG